MRNKDEFSTLIEMLLNLAKSVVNVAQRLAVFLTEDEIVLQRINNKKFCEIFGIVPRTSSRWRKEKRIKYSKGKGGISYLLKDVYLFYEKRNGRTKAKPIVGNRL